MDAGAIIAVLIAGLIVGALGRLIVPGPTTIGLIGTIFLGLVGAIIAAVLAAYVIKPESNFVAFLMAIACAAALIFLFGRPRGRAV